MQHEVTTSAPTNGDASNAHTDTTKGTVKGTSDKSNAPHWEDCASEEKLTGIIQQRQDELLEDISGQSLLRWWRPTTWWTRSDPELLRVYGIIYDGLGEAQRLLAKREQHAISASILRRLCMLLEKGRVQTRTADIHAAWEFAASIERVLLILGDDDYVLAQLESEHELDQKKAQGSWSEYLAVETLEGLLKHYRPGEAGGLRERSVECLSLVHTKRCAYMRTLRACNEMKSHYLNRLTWGLILLLLLLIITIYCASSRGASLWNFFANEHVRSALLAAMMGAVGSTLSGFYKLRDESHGITSLSSFKSARRAQPFVGATAGVFLMLIIKSGVLTGGVPAMATDEGPSGWLSLAVYCFFVGFSEPFFLGIVQRVAGAADKKAQDTPESSTAGRAIAGKR